MLNDFSCMSHLCIILLVSLVGPYPIKVGLYQYDSTLAIQVIISSLRPTRFTKFNSIDCKEPAEYFRGISGIMPGPSKIKERLLARQTPNKRQKKKVTHVKYIKHRARYFYSSRNITSRHETSRHVANDVCFIFSGKKFLDSYTKRHETSRNV